MSEDLAYLGGLIDGEGYIGIHDAVSRNSARGRFFHPAVKVASTDRQMCEFFFDRWGGRIDSRRFPESKNNKDAYCWQVTSVRLVKPFIVEILPFLRLKREQAETVLEFCNRPFGKKGQTGRRSGVDGEVAGTISPEEYDIRKALHDRIKVLNHRGRPPAQTE